MAAELVFFTFRYKLRRPITLRDVSSSYRVMAAWGDGSAPAGGRGPGNARTTSLHEQRGWLIPCSLPRHGYDVVVGLFF